ncbi:MAG: hypothetical protein FWC59_02650, partial [Actinomycetia bacterium]|nr:hypothetical protein [Actinomycetes bacterium]
MTSATPTPPNSAAGARSNASSASVTAGLRHWQQIAVEQAEQDYQAVRAGLAVAVPSAQPDFWDFIREGYPQLATLAAQTAPPLVTRTWEFIFQQAAAVSPRKIALVVVDGLSLFDLRILQDSWQSLNYQQDYSWALVPSATPISRQSLLSGLYPR